MTPFVTFVTPSLWNRPNLREQCLTSVKAQRMDADIEHLVLPDYVGDGIGAMYARMPQYASAVHGEYVHILADDDVLEPGAVQELKAFADQWGYPPVIIVNALKYTELGALVLPLEHHGPPVQGRIDLGCIVTRADVWKQHVKDYGQRYEGDFDHVSALWNAGHKFLYKPEGLFLRGAVMRGAGE